MAKPSKAQSQISKAVASQSAGGQQVETIATQSTQLYQGPIPHPNVLAGFDDLVPGTAQRLIDLAVNESEHRRNMERLAISANIENQSRNIAIAEYQSKAVVISDAVSQVLGASVTLACVAGAVYLAIHDQPGIAALLCAVPTGALIQAFFVKRKS
ncbi:DUF2335 domain-containing protein [Rhodoferax mekongensis]|uniref:DUF2335 domain-containing protein n=1 Tax=Rhodoferax mekongensis TaxID=3068341 RepID=UPI0028BF37BF|nr:DUF2335 domain-containing protein [Rhodoferax sp. TBRC 17199]MDT7514691.1 DUF2335 domain-containing protein [Rhodoferax sp. TBRC 17199]